MLREDAFGQVFQVHLVNNADARRHNAEGLESLLPPLEELVALAVALELHVQIQPQSIGTAEKVHLHGMVDHQVDRHERLDHGRVLACRGHRIAHGRQVDEKRHPCEVLQHNAGNDEGNFLRSRLFRVPRGKGADIFGSHLASVAIAQHRLEHNADAHRQPGNLP